MNVILYPERRLWPALCERPQGDDTALRADVAAIMADVRTRGDAAVAAWTERWDGCRPAAVVVPDHALRAAVEACPADLLAAIDTAIGTIRRFHRAQRRGPLVVETFPGIVCRQEFRPLESVGCYVPGGSAPLFSTLLMLAIPAREAGVGRIVVCSPPQAATGLPHPTILAAAARCGVTEVLAMGGVQAVAALAYGTETVRRVRKIVGPGNAWVTAAKQQAAADGVAMDLPAGPSEVLVLADDTAPVASVVADLLAQAEHGADSQVVLVTTSEQLASALPAEIVRQCADLPRAGIVRQSLAHGRCLVVATMDEAVDFANTYAPEHLIIMADDDEALCVRITAAGSVFLGTFTPESLGDYASGTNHTLPTNGWAGAVSGVTLDTFGVSMTVQRATPEALAAIGPTVVTMARAEGLEAHARAVLVRTSTPAARPVTSAAAADTSTGMPGARTAALLLDANESACGSPFAGAEHRYPEAGSPRLRAAFARSLGVSADHVAVGHGSDEVIDLLYRALAEPYRDGVLLVEPAFVMAERSAIANRLPIDRCRWLPGTALDAADVLQAIRPWTRIVMLCSPNNPTGATIPPATIRAIATATPAFVVVDEAYIDYADVPSAIGLLDECPNVVVLRTMSKAWGLAALRCGAAIAIPAVAARLRAITAPFTITAATEAAVVEALDTKGAWKDAAVRWTRQQRGRFAEALAALPCVETVFPSEANFLLVRFHDCRWALEALTAASVAVRDRATEPGCERCLRITVGGPDAQRRVLETLAGGRP